MSEQKNSCQQCIIRKFNALNGLSKDELVHISKCKTSSIVKKGDYLFKEGDRLQGIYCVKDGICKLSKIGDRGKDQIVKLVKRGQFLGERSLIASEAVNLSAVALNDMEVCFIPKDEIMNGIEKNPRFSMNIIKKMALDLRAADDYIVKMSNNSVRERMASLFLYILREFGVDENGHLKVQLSRKEIADMIGTATESAIRLLGQFKKEGIIETEGKNIKILDEEKLNTISIAV